MPILKYNTIATIRALSFSLRFVPFIGVTRSSDRARFFSKPISKGFGPLVTTTN